MTIQTMDGVLAGMRAPEAVTKAAFTGEAAGEWASLFYLAGRPGAGTVPTPGLNGATVDNTANGVIPFTNPAGAALAYLAALQASLPANAVSLWVLDRLWHNSGIAMTTTTAQAITPVALPSRDAAGATNGDGVLPFLEVSTATGNGSPITNTTISYTNRGGGAGNVGTVPSFPATAVAGTLVPVRLAAGDTGVRSVQSITLGTSYVSGTMHLVLARPICLIGAPVSPANVQADAFDLGLPRLYTGSALMLAVLLAGTAVGQFTGSVSYTHG